MEKALRLADIKQADLAEGLGVSRQRINNMIRGYCAIGKKVAPRIVAVMAGYGVTLSEMDLLYPERVSANELVITISDDACQ